MEGILYLLLISFGALLIISIFQFSIYLQQKDIAFLNYSLYLFVMSLFILVRIADARITSFFPLSYSTVETLDPILSNIGFLMYVNFLGVIMNITKAERFYYKSWKIIQTSVPIIIVMYALLQLLHFSYSISSIFITTTSFVLNAFGVLLACRLLNYRNETFFKLIITGTIVAIIGVFSGLIANNLFYHEKLSFAGLYFLLPSMIIETIFLSAALGYRLKMAYNEKNKVQQKLLEETKLSEQLAKQTASLLQKELDIQDMQRRISKDLHDDVGASLSSIHIYSTVAQKLMDNQPEKVREILEQISVNTHQVMENMGDIIWAMKSDTEEETLSAKIKNLGYDLLNASSVNCTYQIDESVNELFVETNVRKQIYLLIKEAFNNIAKHSQANEAFVEISNNGTNLEVVIKDNGIGFDLYNGKQGNGLSNMKERVETLGGTYIIQSQKGNGTYISGNFPITIFRDSNLHSKL